MKKMINKVHVEGKIVEHSLEQKVSQKNNTPYIGGKIVVATDDKGLNAVPVEILYCTQTNKNGSANKNYQSLLDIINAGKTVLKDGAENATMVRIDSNVGLNEWYKDENGKKDLVSTKRVAGGFVHPVVAINADENVRNTFECDMVITGMHLLEADEERGTLDKLIVKGCIFDFAGKIMPVDFSVTNPNGIKYFESKIDATPNTPVFTKVWGRLINETIKETITEESAFGDPVVKEIEKHKRDWVITGMAKETYDFDCEGILLATELRDSMAQREIYLSDLLQKQLEREAKKKESGNAFNVGGGSAAPAPTNGGFSF